MQPNRGLSLLCLVVGVTACTMSELKDWIEGSREVPSDWQAMVPEAALNGLVDLERADEGKTIRLRYHDGEWAPIVRAFEAPIVAAGYTKVGTCPGNGDEGDGTMMFAKASSKGAQTVTVGLSIQLISSGHFSIEARRAEYRMLIVPDGCTLTEQASELCEGTETGGCRFRGL